MLYVTFLDFDFQIHKNELDAINYLLGENFPDFELEAARELYEASLIDGSVEIDYLTIDKKSKTGIILQLPTELVFFNPKQKEKLTNYLINSYSEIKPNKHFYNERDQEIDAERYFFNEWKNKLQDISQNSKTIKDFVKKIHSTDIIKNNLMFQDLGQLLENIHIKPKNNKKLKKIH